MLGIESLSLRAAFRIASFDVLIHRLLMYSAPEESKPFPFPAWAFVLAALSASIAYFGARGDYVTAGVLAAIAVAGFSGYRLGAAGMVGFFAGIAIAAWYAPPLGKSCEPRFAEWFGTAGLANRILSVGTVGAILAILVMTILQLPAAAIMLSGGEAGNEKVTSSYIVEQMNKSPQGHWYPTVVRRTNSARLSDGQMLDTLYYFYFDFDVELPDGLFEPLKPGRID